METWKAREKKPSLGHLIGLKHNIVTVIGYGKTWSAKQMLEKVTAVESVGNVYKRNIVTKNKPKLKGCASCFQVP